LYDRWSINVIINNLWTNEVFWVHARLKVRCIGILPLVRKFTRRYILTQVFSRNSSSPGTCYVSSYILFTLRLSIGLCHKSLLAQLLHFKREFLKSLPACLLPYLGSLIVTALLSYISWRSYCPFGHYLEYCIKR
jgi:hypothetical protein